MLVNQSTFSFQLFYLTNVIVSFRLHYTLQPCFAQSYIYNPSRTTHDCKTPNFAVSWQSFAFPLRTVQLLLDAATTIQRRNSQRRKDPPLPPSLPLSLFRKSAFTERQLHYKTRSFLGPLSRFKFSLGHIDTKGNRISRRLLYTDSRRRRGTHTRNHARSPHSRVWNREGERENTTIALAPGVIAPCALSSILTSPRERQREFTIHSAFVFSKGTVSALSRVSLSVCVCVCVCGCVCVRAHECVYVLYKRLLWRERRGVSRTRVLR